jgi:hypothetical protein
MYYYGTFRDCTGDAGAYCTDERDCVPASALTFFSAETLSGCPECPLQVPRGVSSGDACEVAALMLEARCYLHGLLGLPMDRQRAQAALDIATGYGRIAKG